VPEGGLNADAEIGDYAEDLLHRRPFVEALAEDIRAAPGRSGFVVGLSGPWGYGKSSVLRLLANEVADDTTAVVRFNPWLFSGTAQLVEHFFAELAGQLNASGSEKLQRIAKGLRGYGRVVAPLRYVPYVGGILRSTAQMAADAGDALAGDKVQPSALERAAELREKLAALERPILVIVDDLDRLRDEEVVDVVRLVRLVGDFPNLIYVLAFDRPVIEKSLGSGDRARGRAYLDKIVHLSHELPMIRSDDLTRVLQGAISEAIGDPSQYHFDRDRLTNVFWMGVRQLFGTIRDVRRYANVLPGALRQLQDEVALPDILALEAIRLFEPEVFEGIVAARNVLTRDRPLEFGASDPKANEARIKAIPARASGEMSEPVERMIRQLFPLSERYFGGTTYADGFLREWRAERRVASPEVLDVYLHKRLPPGDLSARDVDRAVRSLGDRKELERLLAGLDPEQLAKLFIRLADHENDFPKERPEGAIAAILRQRGRLRGEGGLLEFGPDVAASRLVYRLLRGREPDAVAEVVKRIDFPDLSGRLDVVKIVGHREKVGQRLVSKAAAERFETELVEGILSSSGEQLAVERELGPLILFARGDRATEVRNHLLEWIGDDRFLVRLVGAHKLVSLGNTVGEVAVRRTVQLNWLALSSLVSPNLLRPRLQAIDVEWIADNFDEDTATLWAQALRYKDDPAAAERDLRRYQGEEEETE
jgi:predicted KAP-like P-loop ATPase